MPGSISRNLSISFFAGIVLIAETLFFHVTKFVLDYVPAMTVISCAVAGIGVGAFWAGRRRRSISGLFSWCCGGTAIALYAAAFVLLRHPHINLLLIGTSAIFVFPSLYVATAFARGAGPRVYLFDMFGAGLAVAAVVTAYRWLASEEIFLVLVTVLPAIGASSAIRQPVSAEFRTPWLTRCSRCSWLIVLSLIGATLLHYQAKHNCLNIARLINPDSPEIQRNKFLSDKSRFLVGKTYDSLEGRLDVILGRSRTFVTYDGFYNDNFWNNRVQDYETYAKPLGIRYPVRDKRVAYGLVPAPRCFVIGPAATGILKPLRMITPVEKIDAVEINPGILQMMQNDYSHMNGGAYKGLRPVLGNALAVLRRSAEMYDIITLINTHSSRWIGALGPPDFLHTKESYSTYFDHLTEDGYLLFEERPASWRGELGVKRMILTLCECLKERGVEDPTKHFFVWEFMSRRYIQQGKTGIESGNDMYYVGMVVSLKPLTGARGDAVVDWVENRSAVFDRFGFAVWREPKQRVFPAYLNAVWSGERFGPFFDRIRTGDMAGFAEGFDATVVTQDCPFPSCSLRRIPEIERLLRVTSVICIGLVGLFAGSVLARERERRLMSKMILFNFVTGFAYFLVEIVLIQSFHSVFLSPTSCLVLVLGVLLCGSAVGGLLAGRVSPLVAVLTLGPLLLVSLLLPDWAIAQGWSLLSTTCLGTSLIFAVGANMGVFFPAGLLWADKRQKRTWIPHMFAINAAAGSLATVVSLYLAIRVGYMWTMAIAVLAYLVAATILQMANRGT